MTQGNWVENNLGEGNCVLAWSSDKSFINYEKKPLIFHTVDRQILNIIRALVENRRWGVLAYPVRRAEISIPSAIEACYGLMETECKRRNVLLISPRLDVRDIYKDLKVNCYPLNDAFPLGVVKTNGEVKPIIQQRKMKLKDTECKLIHTTNPRCLPDKKDAYKIGFIVAEIAGIDKSVTKEFLDWANHYKVPCMSIIETDPYSSNFSIFNKFKIPIWGWNPQSLEVDFQYDMQTLSKNPDIYDNDLSISVKQISNWIRGVHIELIGMKDNDIEHLLHQILEIYFEIKNTGKSSPLYRQATSLIIQTKSSFESMLAPIDFIEKHCELSFLAKSISDRLEVLKRFAQAIQSTDSVLANHIRKVKIIADNLLIMYRKKGNPKFRYVTSEVKWAMNQKLRLAIVNYNSTYSEALQEALEKNIPHFKVDNISQEYIKFLTLKDNYCDTTFDKCIVFGRMPYSHSWLFKVSWAPNMEILAYGTEKALLKHQFQQEEKRYNESFNRSRQILFLTDILGCKKLKSNPPQLNDNEKTKIPFNLNEEETQDEIKFKPLLGDLFQEEDEITTDEIDLLQNEKIQGISDKGDFIVKSAQICFVDDLFLFVRQSQEVPVLRNGKKLFNIIPAKIRIGDKVILVRGSSRQTLAQEILRKADKHPMMQHLGFLINAWTVGLRTGMAEAGDKPKEFLKKLQERQNEEGLPEIKNPLTVIFWMKGDTIGPRNRENIRLIGEIYDKKFLIDNYKEIAKAVSRMRGIHQQIVRRLNDMVIRAGIHGLKGTDNEVIDEELDLHVSDFAGTISLHEVISVNLDADIEKSKMNNLRRSSDE